MTVAMNSAAARAIVYMEGCKKLLVDHSYSELREVKKKLSVRFTRGEKQTGL